MWIWQRLGDGEGQGVLACCSLWGCIVVDMTGWLNNNDSEIQKCYSYRAASPLLHFCCLLSSKACTSYSTLKLEHLQSLFQIKLVSLGELCSSVLTAWLSPSAKSLCYCSRDGTGNFILSVSFPYKQDSRLGGGGRRGWVIIALLGLSLPVWNLCPTGKLVWRLLKPSILSLLCLE